jgi:DivIVA domain-containing protein
MSFSPEELEGAKFPVVKHGYDPHAVEQFLADVATNLRESDDFRRAGEEVATALREFQTVLAEMKAAAEADALRVRTEAEQEAFRVRTDAEQEAVASSRRAEAESVTMRAEAEEAARQLRHDATEDATRLRADAEREREELITHAQSEVSNMLEGAYAEREDAKRIAAAVEHTVTAKRAEFEEYLAAVTGLAESTARTRVAAVLDGYRAEVDRLVAAREQTSAALQTVRSSLEQAVSGLNADVDLTDRSLQDEHVFVPPPLGDDAVEDAVAHALESVASVIETKPDPFS